MAACVAFIIYAGTRIYGTIGPSRAAVAADGSLYLASHGRLHVFGTDGMRRHSIDLEAIGAPPRPSDFDLHRDGRAVLVDPDNPALVRCRLPTGPCERVPVSIDTSPAQEVLPMNAAKIFVDDAGGRYFISDNTGHRVLATTHDGRTLGTSRVNVVRHPNRLALVAPDRLDVVDTDRARIVTFAVSEQGVGPVVGMRSTASRLVRPYHFLPFDAERLPDGSTAVLIAAIGMKDADLVLFGPQGQPVTRANLDADADPFDVVLWRNRLWVADATRYTFRSVNLDLSVGDELEDALFLEELAGARREPEAWKERRRLAQFALVGIPLLGALLFWKLAEPPPRAPAAPSPTQGSGVEWIRPRAAFRRRLRWFSTGLAWIVLGTMTAFAAWVMVRLPVFTWAGVRSGLPFVGVCLAVALVTFVTLRASARSFEKLRLGSGPDALHFELAPPFRKLRRGAAAWKDVYFDGKQRLLVGANLLVVWQPLSGAIFDEGEFRRAILDRMPPANVVPDRRQFMQLAWPAVRKPMTIILVVTFVLVAFQLAQAFRLL